MKASLRSIRMFAPLLAAVCGLSTLTAYGKGSDLIFKGSVSRISQSSTQSGNLAVHTDLGDVRVLVNPETVIDVQGESIQLKELRPDDSVKVFGFFSPAGVVAKEIQIEHNKPDDFRLHGTISNVLKSGSATQMNLLGVMVQTDDRTTILKSGSNDLLDDRSLAAGVEVEIHGSFRDGQLTADRMWVGKREDNSSELRFEGQIASIQDSHISIDTHGGGTAGVLLTTNTVIKGAMAVGKEVEVKGFLNAQLEVEAQLVKMDDVADDNGNDGNVGDDKGGNGGNDKTSQPPMMKAITLASAGSSIHGDADIESEMENGQLAQHLDVEIEDAQPNATYQVQVSSAKAGALSFTLTADAKGKAKLRIDSFDAGIDVRDFTGIQISFNGAVILQGSF